MARGRTKLAALRDAAALLGRRGGLKGGPARNRTLSQEQRIKIATMGGHAKAAAAKEHGG